MEGHGRVLYAEGCHLWRDRVEPLAQASDRMAEAMAFSSTQDSRAALWARAKCSGHSTAS